MNEITKQEAIDIYQLVENDSYACEISTPDGNNREISFGNGGDMIMAINDGHYTEYYLSEADQNDAVAAYSQSGLGGEGFSKYRYHVLTIVSPAMMETAYIPVGGW